MTSPGCSVNLNRTLVSCPGYPGWSLNCVPPRALRLHVAARWGVDGTREPDCSADQVGGRTY